MRLRIAMWTGVGALVVVLWTLYISSTSPTSLGNVRILAYLTLSHRAGSPLRPQFLFRRSYQCCYICVSWYCGGNRGTALQARLISN